MIHTDNDVHTMIEVGCRAGFVDLFVVHTKQMLCQYYLKNFDSEGEGGEVGGWVEEDASLRCSSTLTPFMTSTCQAYRKVEDVDASKPESGKQKKMVKRCMDKGKGKTVDEAVEDVDASKPESGKQKKRVKRSNGKRKGKMVDEAVVVTRNKPASIVIRDDDSMNNRACVGSVNVGAKGGRILRPRMTNCVLGLQAPRSMGNNVVLF